MGKETLRSMVLQREAEIARLRTALREVKQNIENDDEACAYLIIKIALNQLRGDRTRRDLNMPEAKSGIYFYVDCPNCKERIIFQEAPRADEIAVVMTKGVTLACPRCGEGHSYPAGRIGRGLVENKKQ